MIDREMFLINEIGWMDRLIVIGYLIGWIVIILVKFMNCVFYMF